MARLGGELVEVFRADAPPDVVRRHFVDLDRIVAATSELERYERVDEQTVRLVVHEQRHGPTSFQPDYVVRYRLYGDDQVVWETLHGNLVSEGSARFAPRPDGGTDIHYRHAVAFELPVPGLVARVLQPVVTSLLAPSLRRFVAQMIATLPPG